MRIFPLPFNSSFCCLLEHNYIVLTHALFYIHNEANTFCNGSERKNKHNSRNEQHKTIIITGRYLKNYYNTLAIIYKFYQVSLCEAKGGYCKCSNGFSLAFITFLIIIMK